MSVGNLAAIPEHPRLGSDVIGSVFAESSASLKKLFPDKVSISVNELEQKFEREMKAMRADTKLCMDLLHKYKEAIDRNSNVREDKLKQEDHGTLVSKLQQEVGGAIADQIDGFNQHISNIEGVVVKSANAFGQRVSNMEAQCRQLEEGLQKMKLQLSNDSAERVRAVRNIERKCDDMQIAHETRFAAFALELDAKSSPGPAADAIAISALRTEIDNLRTSMSSLRSVTLASYFKDAHGEARDRAYDALNRDACMLDKLQDILSGNMSQLQSSVDALEDSQRSLKALFDSRFDDCLGSIQGLRDNQESISKVFGQSVCEFKDHLDGVKHHVDSLKDTQSSSQSGLQASISLCGQRIDVLQESCNVLIESNKCSDVLSIAEKSTQPSVNTSPAVVLTSMQDATETHELQPALKDEVRQLVDSQVKELRLALQGMTCRINQLEPGRGDSAQGLRERISQLEPARDPSAQSLRGRIREATPPRVTPPRSVSPLIRGSVNAAIARPRSVSPGQSLRSASPLPGAGVHASSRSCYATAGPPGRGIAPVVAAVPPQRKNQYSGRSLCVAATMG